MLISELHEIMVEKATFVGFRGVGLLDPLFQSHMDVILHVRKHLVAAR